MTTWNPNIPNPGDIPASDATAMQQNFSVVDSAFAQDHVNLALATNQGFHKQISLIGAGTVPYSVSGTQNYEYARLLGSNVRSYLEYQPSGPDTFAGNPAVVPLSFKAFVRFATLAGSGAISIFTRRFNIASVQQTGITSWAVTFNEAMPDANYLVIQALAVGGGNLANIISSQTTTAFTVSQSSGVVTGTIYGLGVL